MFIQILSITHPNSYIVYKNCSKIKPMTHKTFILDKINRLMENLHKYKTNRNALDGNMPIKAVATASAPALLTFSKTSTSKEQANYIYFLIFMQPRIAYIKVALTHKFINTCVVCSELYSKKVAECRMRRAAKG